MHAGVSILAALFLSIGPALGQSPLLNAQAAGAAGPALASHRAVYDLSLARVGHGEGVRAAKGTMVYTLTDRCDGYTIESDSVMELAFASGVDSEVEQRYAAWEAKDGRSSTFRMQIFENGKLSKAYRGTAQLGADGAGKATYESDSIAAFDLPRGTLLSTAHTLALLKNAAAGEHFIGRTVFDGTFDEGPFRVSAVIGPLREPRNSVGKNQGNSGLESNWPVELAYFPLSSEKDTPDYEISMALQNDGIARSMTQDFGGFALGFVLVRVDLLPAPHC